VQLLGADAIVAAAIVVALTVTSTAQTRFRKDLFIHLALFAERYFGLERVDFRAKLWLDRVG
jgi:hypothetical protein